MVRKNYDSNSSVPVEVSLEHKYAESLDLDLGDPMQIEVGGVSIDAQVVNLRRKVDQFSAKLFCPDATRCPRKCTQDICGNA